ncbi:hypothetical protein [Agrobacterium tumefaciens]|uniref:hypothetical protein n=1 Tax=Agrobacterium tumefaciens TaxID=358 RepID=UPI0022440762|nr:hypothetical protein [Agrobacterium tumefaciens]MCW8060473.1 hypothetical protein [Agrobacterium tumefaciens]MCW8145917.1 hypothetical protein [Agrobacterium tumefaciens]
MGEQQTSFEAIIRAEIAIGIMNRARGLICERVATLAIDDPDGAEKLRGKRRALLAIQNGIRVRGTAQVEAVIREWGPRVRDTALLWREL